jgi:hypothetical protein
LLYQLSYLGVFDWAVSIRKSARGQYPGWKTASACTATEIPRRTRPIAGAGRYGSNPVAVTGSRTRSKRDDPKAVRSRRERARISSALSSRARPSERSNPPFVRRPRDPIDPSSRPIGWTSGPTEVLPLCPCSLGAWTASADPTPVSAGPAHPYGTWPTLAGDTAVWSGFRGAVAIRDCARRDLAVTADFGVMFARLDGPLFVAVGSANAARGAFASDVCSDAAPFTLPATLAAPGGAPVAIAIARDPGLESSVYLTLDAPFALTLALDTATDGALSVCATCDATGADCQTIPVGSTGIRVSGRFHLRWDAPATRWPYAQVSFRATPG